MTNSPDTGAQAHTAILQRNSEEVIAIILEMVQAAADREGRAPGNEHFNEGIALLLTAAWRLSHITDRNDDGGRAARYAELLRLHADTVERLG